MLVFFLFAILLFISSFLSLTDQQYLLPCWDAKQSQAIYKTEASEEELRNEILLVQNTKRPELASVFMSKDVDPQTWVGHTSRWSMSKQHYLAAQSRQDGLRTKVAQLELVCFNLSIGVSNNFNIVFRLTSSCGVLFIISFSGSVLLSLGLH